MEFSLRQMIESDVEKLARAFAHWNKTREQYARYWLEHRQDKRTTLVAVSSGQVVGYANLLWHSGYLGFQRSGIPEINDMNVVEQFQRRGIASALVREAERLVCEQGKRTTGIGFGLTADYGPAQRLYPKLGYIPDGKGAQHTPEGDVLFLVKDLSCGGEKDECAERYQ